MDRSKLHHQFVPNRRDVLAMGLAQAAILGVGPAAAQERPRRRFILFDGMLHRGRPRNMGLTPCNVVYQHEFFPRGAKRSQLPDPAVTRALGEKYGKTGHFTSLDLELYHKNPQRLEWYRIITKDFRSTYGNGPLSHYGTLPASMTPRTLMAGKESPAYRKWQAMSDRWYEVLGAYVNVFSPPIYFYGKDEDFWERRARAYAAEARRLNPNAAFVPYITFNYSTFARKPAGEHVPRAFWRRKLEVLHEIADGVIIWGGYKKNWDQSAEWWLETQEFMSRRP